MPGRGGRGCRLGTGPFWPGIAGLLTVPGAPGPVVSPAAAIRRVPRLLLPTNSATTGTACSRSSLELCHAVGCVC